MRKLTKKIWIYPLLVAGFVCILLLSLNIAASAFYNDHSTKFQDFMESFEITPLDGQITTEVNFDVVEPIIVATELPSDPRNVEVYDFSTNVVTTYPYSDYAYSDYEDKTIVETIPFCPRKYPK